MSDEFWVPVEKLLPNDEEYVLVAFKNFSLPIICIWDAEDECFYIGDTDERADSDGMIVGWWTRLPDHPMKEE